MQFGQDKCSYMMVIRGKIIDQAKNIYINSLSIFSVSNDGKLQVPRSQLNYCIRWCCDISQNNKSRG